MKKQTLDQSQEFAQFIYDLILKLFDCAECALSVETITGFCKDVIGEKIYPAIEDDKVNSAIRDIIQLLVINGPLAISISGKLRKLEKL